jgi:Stealth protein CR2, conserved region 2/Stealth protein CR4, conserved region 4/Stealth protein CR3, conserved region 3/Stealth protein CR1, conserved region 1
MTTGSAATHNFSLEPATEPDSEFGSVSGAGAVPRSWPATHGRPDVVVRKGVARILNRDLTPRQALVEDLLFIRRVLIDAGIEFLFVRGNDERPVIAIDESLRSRAERAFALACKDEPMYSKTIGGNQSAPVLLADGVFSPRRKARIFRLFRPRIEPVGGLSYGVSTGIEVQLWRFGVDEIDCPVENSLTRRMLPRSEDVREQVALYGENWTTLRGMFDPHASDVRFDIDIVFSWVDGTDIEFQRQRAKRMQSYVVGDGDDSEARYRQIDELKFALRSIYIFAPWVRRIFIVTDSPRPVWLAPHPAVSIVRSEEFFSDRSALPTHNSQAVESQLQHIPGLSEHFLYSNDDMFFGRPVQPGMFFSSGGVSKFIEAQTRIGLGESDPGRSGYENAARVNRRLMKERFGVVITRHLEHAATPLRRSVLEEMETEFPDDFARTQRSAFRASTDISVTNSLYHYYSLMTGRAVQQENARVKYVDTTSRSELAELPRLLKNRSHDFFCLNDGSYPEVSADERAHIVVDFLERYFPIPAPWELPADSEQLPV